MTTLALEQAEQTKWQVLPGRPPATWADELLRNEFLGEDQERARQRRMLRDTLRFAADTVPYYRQLFRRLRLGGADLDAPDALSRVPVLTRTDLRENAAALRNPNVPPEMRHHLTRSSGSTGEPIAVLQSLESLGMFGRLKQREDRWFRFDPAAKMSSVRATSDLPRMRDGSLLPDKTVLRISAWPFVGDTFRTGPWAAFGGTNAIEDQVEFLRGEGAAYFVAHSAAIEHVALASQGPIPGLRACLATSMTFTPAMRATVERLLGVPVHENYGFNEVGIAASRCPEGGRFHVHTEHCLIEIVDTDGQAVRPGERGRILATSLTNRAMPLIRYDCDDFATAVEGPCPCGRSLPSFGEIHGRYRRIAYLPRGSWSRWAAVRHALLELPPQLQSALRQFQAHEYADRSWVLRIHATDGKAEAIGALVRPLFEAAAPDAPPLDIVATREFEGRPGAKFQDYISDFVPGPDAAPPPPDPN